MLDDSSLTVAIPIRQMKDIDQHTSYHGPVFRDFRQSKTQNKPREPGSGHWNVAGGLRHSAFLPFQV